MGNYINLNHLTMVTESLLRKINDVNDTLNESIDNLSDSFSEQIEEADNVFIVTAAPNINNHPAAYAIWYNEICAAAADKKQFFYCDDSISPLTVMSPVSYEYEAPSQFNDSNINLYYIDATYTQSHKQAYNTSGMSFDVVRNIDQDFMVNGYSRVTAGKQTNSTVGSNATIEGANNIGSGADAHAEGYGTTASGIYSHSEGRSTIAQRASQHVFGAYNIADTTGNAGTDKGSYIEIVGNGTADALRSNARTLDWSGNETLAGKLTVGAGPTNNMDVATKQYVDSVIPTVPTNVSAFTNDVGYLISSDISYPVTSVNGQTGAVSLTIPTIPQVVQNNTATGQVMFQNAGDLAPKINDGVGIGRGYINLGRNGESAATQGYISFINATYTGGQTLLKPTYSGSSAITVYLPIASGTLALEDKLKTTAGSDNTEYNLIGTATSNANTTTVSVYNPGLISFAKSSSLARLTLGSTTVPGTLRLYSSADSASGFIDLISSASSTNERTITLPDATGTVALISDIPSISSWALAANKPSYTFSELTSHPTTIGGYGITDAYTKTEVDGMVSGVLHYKGTKATVSALPSSGNTTGDVWHITADGSEYAWDGSAWQELGTATDLSGYVPTSRTINGKALTSNISLTASDVSALPSSTTYVSSFNGDTGAITYTAPVTSVNGQTGAVTLTIPDPDIYWVGIDTTINWTELVSAYNANKLIVAYGSGSGGDTLIYNLIDIKITHNTTETATSDDYISFTYTLSTYNNEWRWEGSTKSWTQTVTSLSRITHTHGYITNEGDITTNATIDNGDRIVINDESASRIKNSSITFGISTTQYLANNGTWQNVPTTSVTQTLTSGTAIGTVGGTTLYAPTAYDDTALAARVTALEQIPWVTYHTGNTTPANSFGNNGDLYLETN